jgi:hypothetical protein
MKLVQTYGGVVENNKDPLKMGRLKVRVPHVYGSTDSGSGFVATNSLPWAMPAGLPAGGSGSSGGFSQLPDAGDKVWVRFLDGEPEKPIWEWGMQSYADTEALKLHSYKTNIDGSLGSPDRAVWTRYSHAFELNEGGIIISTSGGYRAIFNDSTTVGSMDGSIVLSTPFGNSIEFDDVVGSITLNGLEDVNFQIGNSFLGQSFDYSWLTAGDYGMEVGGILSVLASEAIEMSTATDFSADAIGAITLSAGTTFNLTALQTMSLQFTQLFLGINAVEPVVLGAKLITFIEALMTYLSAHTHTSSSSGGPTSPPVIPSEATLAPQVAGLVSSTVFTA